MSRAADWQKLAEMADAMPVPLIGLDGSGELRWCNRAAGELLLFESEQLAGKRLAELFRDPERASEFWTSLQHGSVESQPFVVQRGDGSKLRVEASPGSLAGLHGLDNGWLLMLRNSESDARAQRDLSRNIESVAHDMRSPLASLMGFTNLLRREFGGQLDAVGRGYLDSLRSNIQSVEAQLERLIELGRVPERELERSRMLANVVFQSVAEELSEDLDTKGIQLSLPSDPQMVYANRNRFQQVVFNLVVNALQHMGSVEDPQIIIDLKPASGGHMLVISANGIGMPPEQHLRIYDLFRSAQWSADIRTGGLGLSIVKRIVASHGGWVELDSAPFRGASFRVFFPDCYS